MAGNTSEPGRSVTARALAILDVFDTVRPPLSLSEIARRAGLPLPTAHRLAGELESWQALERDENGLYHVGQRLWELGLLSRVCTRLREVAMPFMQDVYEATRENVQLAVRNGFDALYVEKLSGHRSVPIVTRIGGRLPMHATGVGKALLAFESPQFRREYVDRPLERPTRYTMVEPGRLWRDLVETRRRGYAVTREEMTLGSYSVAVPIHDGEEVVAALSIVVHTVRAEAAKLAPVLRTAARGIERRLQTTCDDPYPGLFQEGAPRFPTAPPAPTQAKP